MRFCSFFFFCFSLLTSPSSAIPDFKKGSVIVDEEINASLTEWVEKLFKVAGLMHYTPSIYLIVDPDLNAFTSGAGQLVIHTGLIQNCRTSGELLGVLAHEVGHIAGGHIAQIDQASKGAMMPAAMALFLGGAASLAMGDSTPLVAGLSGGIHLFHRGMLKFTRTQESSADQAALSYLDRLNWGGQGLLNFFKLINRKYQTFTLGLDPYSVTHPLTPERIKTVEDHLFLISSLKSPPLAIEKDFQRMRAKVIGFFGDSKKMISGTDPDCLSLSEENKRYARSIAFYRTGQFPKAIEGIQSLIKDSPDNPYFYEFKGQVLLDSGKTDEAIKSLEVATQKRPLSKYIPLLLAHALLESQKQENASRAKGILVPLTQKDPENVFAWRLLATAYGKLKEEGQASLALAEEAFAKRDIKRAKAFALRAKNTLKSSSGILRINDILNMHADFFDKK